MPLPAWEIKNDNDVIHQVVIGNTHLNLSIVSVGITVRRDVPNRIAIIKALLTRKIDYAIRWYLPLSIHYMIDKF